MGYAFDVMTSIPIAFILYILSEKIVHTNTKDDKYDISIQKNHIIMFIIGLVFLLLANTIFDEKKKIKSLYNRPLQYAMYISGILLLINSMIINWDILNENTKILILMLTLGGCIVLSFKWSE